MNNTKMHCWVILLEEYNAKIEYRKGRHHVRADMLSHLTTECEKSGPNIIDSEDWVDPQPFRTTISTMLSQSCMMD